MLAATFHAAIAQSQPTIEGAIMNCSERDSNFQRLECYDALAARLIQSTPRAAAPRLSGKDLKAEKKTEQNGAPATVSTTAKLLSRREVRLKSGTILRPELIVVCGRNHAGSVALGTKLPVGKVAVNTRVDKEEVVKELWSVTSDKTGVSAPGGAAFIARLKGRKVLEVKVAPRKGEPIPFSFDLTSIDGGCPELLVSAD